MSIFRTILASGSFNISDLLPWRQYVVQVMATSIEHSITDYISKDFSTPEEGKNPYISPIGLSILSAAIFYLITVHAHISTQ